MSIRTAELKLDVLVVGAGIAGLACAYALIRAGHSVRVIERSSPDEQRAGGIRIPPNMHKTLVEWGLDDQLKQSTQQCRGSTFHLLDTGEKVGYLEWKDEVVKESGGDFLLIHHADLHRMLRDLAVKAGASITYNTTVTNLSIPGSDRSPTGISTPSSTRSLDSSSTEDLPDFALHINEKGHVHKQGEERKKPQVHLSSGHTLTADLVIGADGFHSVVRQYVWDQQGTDTNMSVLTLTIPAEMMKKDEQLKDLVDIPEWPMWMGTNRSVLGYPVRQGKEYCVHLFWPNDDILPTESDKLEEEWNICISTDRIVMDGYDPAIQRLVRMAPDAIRTKFINRGLVEDWIDEECKFVLLGEAAHPVMPCGIYGSSLGVEDAAVLGVLLSRLRTANQIPLLLEAYQDLRQPRCQAVSSSEFSNASLVWLPPGPERDLRDAGMRASLLENSTSASTTPSEEQLREQYDTIGEVFGYSAREAAEDWWVQWGSLGESSRGGHASVYEPLDLKFEINEVTTSSDAPGWVKDIGIETKISA